VWLAPEHKLQSPDDYDSVICAELPDPELEPDLFAVVTTCHLHGPCGRDLNQMDAPCMKECKRGCVCCCKSYPKEFSATTLDSADGYPIYRRRDDGRAFVVKGVRLVREWCGVVWCAVVVGTVSVIACIAKCTITPFPSLPLLRTTSG
jgi:hypothetical protein